MASVGTYLAKDGRIYSRLLFVDPADGRRRTLRLGGVNKEQVANVKGMIERLVKSRATGTPDAVAAVWLAGLPDASYAKIAKVGLAMPRTPAPAPKPEPAPAPKPRLGQFLNDYIKGRTDLKPNSITVLRHAARNLCDCFGSDRALDSVSEGDADGFRMYLMAEKLSAATVARRCGFAKQFFRAAARHRLIPGNPFGDLKSCGAKANKERQRFVTREDTKRLIDACPCVQWRTIIILSRYAGMRCPSEVLRLKWSDVDWERGRITVHSPKTERYAGHETRQTPLFPEVREALMDLLDQTEAGGPDRIIKRYPVDTPNLRQEFGRIAKRAGLSDLPKPFVNLRGSCETELTATFPAHVTAAWLGHTPKIAEAHYLMVTAEHFERAIQPPADTKGPAKKTAHGTAQQIVVGGSMDSQPVTAPAFFDVKRESATTCEFPVDRVGIEPT